MSFSEIVLRLGCTLVAWLVGLTHGLMLANIRVMPCASGSTDPFLTTLGFGLVSAAFLFLLPVGRKVPGVSRPLQWLLLPLFVLAPFAAREVVPLFVSSTLGSEPLCAASASETLGGQAVGWERIWAPLQLGILLSWFWVGWLVRSADTSRSARAIH